MQFKGNITETKVYIPHSMSCSVLSLTIETPYTYESGDEIDRLEGKDLQITLNPWREKRSKSANAYFHVLSDKLADAMRMSKPKMKNYLLFHYGQKVRDKDGSLVVIKTNADEEELISRSDLHLWYLKDSHDGTPMYVLLEHSSLYNTLEMSILIDGTVLECRNCGIEVLPPDEIERMKQSWGVDL